jgi:hypothetical protein
VQKLNQGFPRRLGVLSGGGLFWLPFWASKKVKNLIKADTVTVDEILFMAQYTIN